MPDANVTNTQPNLSSPSQGITWRNIIIGVIIGVVLFGVGGYLVYNADQPQKEEPPQATSTTKTSTPSATSDNSPSGWQTVRGEISRWQKSGVYRFEFKAPKEWKTTTPYPNIPQDSQKYYFGTEGSGITFFAGLMEGPGPLTVLYGRADKSGLCAKPLELQELSEGVFEVCDILQLDGREALWLIDVRIGSNSHASACEQNASLHVVYNFGEGTSLFFTPKLDVLKEIIEPWAKVLTTPVGVDDKGVLQVCPEGIDYKTVKENLAAKIKSIRNAKGLSDSDNQTLQVLYQTLSTFKFLD